MNIDAYSRFWEQVSLRILDIQSVRAIHGQPQAVPGSPASFFLYGVRGQAQIRLNGRPYIAGPHRLFHGGPETGLRIDPTEPRFDYYLLSYRTKRLEPETDQRDSADPNDDPPGFVYAYSPRRPLPLLSMLRTMEQLRGRPDSLARLQFKSEFYRFIHELMSQMSEHGELASPDAVGQAMDLIRQHYAESLTLERLAQDLGYSVSHLSALFKKRTGISPIDYLIRVRMKRALHLLRSTDASIGEIAAEVGYSDVYYFGRLFKKHWGLSPSRYRSLPHDPESEDYPGPAIDMSIVANTNNLYIDNVNENHYQLEGDHQHMNIKGKKISIGLALGSALLLNACGMSANSNEGSATPSQGAPSAEQSAPASASAPRTVKDDFGHEINVPEGELRILAPYQEDALIALGVTPVAKYAAGTTVQDHLEPWLKDLPKLDLMNGLSPEVVLGHDPDLIIVTSHFLPIEQYDTIAKIAPVYLIQGGNSDWRDNLNKVAGLLGNESLAEQKLAEYETELQNAKALLSGAADQTVAIVWPSDKEFFLIGSEFLSGKLLYGELGLKPHSLATTVPDNFVQLSLEKLAELDADKLFVITPEGQTDEQVREMLASLPLWNNLPAVKQNRVYQVASGHWINSAYNANLAILKDVLDTVEK